MRRIRATRETRHAGSEGLSSVAIPRITREPDWVSVGSVIRTEMAPYTGWHEIKHRFSSEVVTPSRPVAGPDPASRAGQGVGGDLGRLAHGGALNLIGAGIGSALGFAFTAVASRQLGAARAGAFFS